MVQDFALRNPEQWRYNKIHITNLLFRNRMVLYDTFCHFLELWPGQHDETAAALALDAKIHPCTQNFPKIAAARMLLFHAHDITDLIMNLFHELHLLFPLL